MKTIAEIGSNRLKKVLVTDKKQDPSKLCAILKSDIEKVFEDYLELDNAISIDLKSNDNLIEFTIKASAVRIKDYGILPE